MARKCTILLLFSGIKRKKALKIVANTNQRPLALHGAQPAQQELAEALGLLNDTEDGLDGGFALGIAGFAFAGFQAMGIGLYSTERGFGWIGIVSEALGQRRVVALATLGDERFNTGCFAALKVLGTVESGVG